MNMKTKTKTTSIPAAATTMNRDILIIIITQIEPLAKIDLIADTMNAAMVTVACSLHLLAVTVLPGIRVSKVITVGTPAKVSKVIDHHKVIDHRIVIVPYIVAKVNEAEELPRAGRVIVPEGVAVAHHHIVLPMEIVAYLGGEIIFLMMTKIA